MNTIFNFIGDIISIPFGYILSFFYNLTDSYILALILLTIIIKLCFLPISINKQKSILKTEQLNMEINKIKKKYSNNEQKIKQETEELQKKYAGKKNAGCITSLLQFFILIGAFRTICAPLTNILRFNKETIEGIKTVMSEITEKIGTNSIQIEIKLLQDITNYKETLISTNVLTKNQFEQITNFINNFKLFGIDLSLTPEFTEITNLIPLFVLITSVASVIYTIIKQRKKSPQKHKGKYLILDSTRFAAPAISYIFAFMFPAGVGLYWSISNLLSFIQEIILTKIFAYKKTKLQEKNKTNK